MKISSIFVAFLENTNFKKMKNLILFCFDFKENRKWMAQETFCFLDKNRTEMIDQDRIQSLCEELDRKYHPLEPIKSKVQLRGKKCHTAFFDNLISRWLAGFSPRWYKIGHVFFSLNIRWHFMLFLMFSEIWIATVYCFLMNWNLWFKSQKSTLSSN